MNRQLYQRSFKCIKFKGIELLPAKVNWNEKPLKLQELNIRCLNINCFEQHSPLRAFMLERLSRSFRSHEIVPNSQRIS